MLSASNFKQCYVPPGFAHGFCVVSADAQIEYKCTDVYDPASEVGVIWNDPTLAIPWPIAEPLVSDRDRRNRSLQAALDELPVWSDVR
jgi:dTDP-4-dehydrorhamnose 3,5-epimerase